MTEPRILLLGPTIGKGGTERHLASVLPAMAARGIDVQLHVLARGGVLEGPISAAGIPIQGAPPGLSASARAARVIGGLAARLRKLRPCLVHLFLPEPALLGSIATRLQVRPRIVVSRRSLTLYRQRRPFLGALDWLATCSADALIGNSRAVADELVTDCGNAAKVGLIHNGVAIPDPLDVGERIARRARIGVEPNALLLAVVANLIHYKGHADLIAALAIAATRMPPGFRLALLGRDDGIGRNLDTLAAKAGLSDHILRLGARQDATEILAAADIAVLPSHEEGFSNSLIEGLAAGVPSIATRIGGNIDAIEDGTSGLLVPPRGHPPFRGGSDICR